MRPSPDRARWTLAALGALVALLAAASPAVANPHPSVPSLHWTSCGEIPGVECATATVPRDYAKPHGPTIKIALARSRALDPGQRIGSLFINFGGPGSESVSAVEELGPDLFPTLSDRFDLIGFAPRGVSPSEPSIDCRVNQETVGLYAQPFTTPENLDVRALVDRSKFYVRSCLDHNPGILPYVATANVARDMDLVRAALGERKLNYLGFSYGTYLGASYATLFPRRYRALVLDGAIDPDQYANHPTGYLLAQNGGFERALGRFFQACAAHQDVCGFGGDDPWSAYDELLEQLDATPLPSGGEDPRPVDGDDLRAVTLLALYSKWNWPVLALILQEAEAGDGTFIREVVNGFYGLLPDGTFDPFGDRYFTIEGVDQRFKDDVDFYLRVGADSWATFDHFWWNAGYSEMPWGLYPVKPRGAYYGPFGVPRSSPVSLVVGNTYDPATVYRGAKRLVAQLGRARLLTMRGDGHTAYYGNSPCIDAAVDAYLERLVLPAPGTVCRQEVPFEALAARAAAGPMRLHLIERMRLHVRPGFGR
jgi:pimeloyl-ACP methyl ester carboxylesterase